MDPYVGNLMHDWFLVDKYKWPVMDFVFNYPSKLSTQGWLHWFLGVEANPMRLKNALSFLYNLIFFNIAHTISFGKEN